MSETEEKNIDEIGSGKENDFIALSAAAKISGYTPEYLNLLCRKKELRGKKLGRNWYTTLAWLEEFIALKKGNSIEAEKLPGTIMLEEVEKEKKRGYRIVPALASLIIIFPLALVAIKTVKQYRLAESKAQATISLAETNGTEDKITNENLGQVAGVTDVVVDDKPILGSENFGIERISLGGDVLAFSDSEELPLGISDVRSESFLANKKDQVKLIISWKTNRMAISEIDYAKNNGQNNKTLEEDSFGFNHSVVVTDVEPRTSYVYYIKSKDRFGNEVRSDYFGIYTASQPVSVFDLISKAMNDTFGWAVKK